MLPAIQQSSNSPNPAETGKRGGGGEKAAGWDCSTPPGSIGSKMPDPGGALQSYGTWPGPIEEGGVRSHSFSSSSTLLERRKTQGTHP